MKYISKYYYLITYIMFVILCLVAIKQLFLNWSIIFWDIDFWFNNSLYTNRLFPVRNELRSTSNFFNMPRLLFILPFFKIFGNAWDNWLFERATFIFTILLAGASMISMSYSIIQKYIKLEKHTYKLYISVMVWLISWWLFYALNPYALVRIHHFYLYVWYAIFPLFIKYLILLYNRPFEESTEKKGFIINHIKSIFILSVLFMILSASVHYIVFSFIVIWLLWLYNFIYYIINKQYKNAIFMTTSIIFLVSFFVCMLWYFILPYIEASSIPDFWPKNINTIDTINLFSRFSSFQNIILLKSYRRPMYDYWKLWNILNIWWYIIIINILICSFINRKNRFIKWMIAILIVLILSASWNYYVYIAPVYSYLVLKNPISQTLWLIFRDPNKIVWIMSVIYWFLLSRWIYQSSQIISNIYTEKQKYAEKIKNILYRVFIWISMVWVYLYIYPLTFDYMRYFYNPLDAPQEYKNLEQYNLSIDNSRSIFMPRYEKEKLPWYDFAITSRNNKEKVPKPTWSADIYSIPLPTYHPLEWNDEFVNYFYDFLDSYFYNWYWVSIVSILKSINIKYLFYHKDIIWRENIDSIQLKNISIQKWIKMISEKWFMTVRDTNNSWSEYKASTDYIYSFWWIRDWLSCSYTLKSYWYDCESYILSKQLSNATINSWKTVIVNNKEDYNFWKTQNKIIISPFDIAEWSNPQIWRAKVKISSSDRLYYLDFLDIINYVRDFDYWKWAIFTFSPSKFIIPSYDKPMNFWKIFFNLQDIEDISQFLIWWDDANESNITFALDKKWANDEFPSIKSSLAIWDSQIRRLWNSKFFNIKEKNWYWFKIKVSWLHINNLHMKIRFFDNSFKELWIWYMSTPELASVYDKLELEDSFMSPKWSKYLQIQFYSLENLKTNSFWWLHDLQIKDLSDIVVDNNISINFKINTWWLYNLYARLFDSSKWWKVKFNINNSVSYIDTKLKWIWKFKRYYLWMFKINTWSYISWDITNIEWFNSLNLLRLDPESNSKVYNNNQVILQEAELYSQYSWNIQSYKHYPLLSNWKSVNISSWYIKFDFDILNDWNYNININRNKFFIWSWKISIYISWNNQIIKLFEWDLDKLEIIKSKDIKKWNYELIIYVEDNNKSLLNINDIKINSRVESWWKIFKEDSFDTENRKNNYKLSDSSMFSEKLNKKNNIIDDQIFEDEKWCSYFYDWKPEDYKIIKNNNKFSMNFNSWYWCKWLIISEEKIKIKPDNEYIIMFDIYKIYSKRLHAKVQFFDWLWNLIKTKNLKVWDDINWKNIKINNQLFDLEAGSYWWQYKWHYEDIITSPEWANYMTLERWQKQRQDKDSYFDIDNLILKEYKSMAWIDSVVISNNNIFNENIKTDNNFVIKQNTPYSPLRWIEWKSAKPFHINLFINWFYNKTSENLKFEYIPNRKFKIWIYLTFIWFTFWVIILIIAYIKNNKKSSNK